MPVKKIPHTAVQGAEKLTPLQMNKIAFDTGHHSPLDSRDTAKESKDKT